MAEKIMYIPNNNTQIYSFCRVQLVIKTLKLNDLTNQNSEKVKKSC